MWLECGTKIKFNELVSTCLINKNSSGHYLMNPIEALVEPIPKQHTKIPGIFMTFSMDLFSLFSLIIFSRSGSMRSVNIAHMNNDDPSTTNGK